MACKLTPGVHLQGLVYHEVGGEFVAEIPVVHRVRRRCRCNRPYRIDVTWQGGRVGRYLPDVDLPVLEVPA